jgi:hypothetical protein
MPLNRVMSNPKEWNIGANYKALNTSSKFFFDFFEFNILADAS